MMVLAQVVSFKMWRVDRYKLHPAELKRSNWVKCIKCDSITGTLLLYQTITNCFSEYFQFVSIWHYIFFSKYHPSCTKTDPFALLCSAIIYHCDLSELNPEPKVFREVEVKGVKQEDFQTNQVILNLQSSHDPFHHK